ncbi:MAG: hypothetical protein NVSMB48_02330 [Marmoricola sp.]
MLDAIAAVEDTPEHRVGLWVHASSSAPGGEVPGFTAEVYGEGAGQPGIRAHTGVKRSVA